MLSDGEYVVNARSTAKHRALLEVINSGRVPACANGGIVGSARIGSASTGAAGTTIAPTININVEGGSRGPEADRQLAAQIGRQVEGTVRGLVQKELRSSMRPGGVLGR